jgi:enoyl-[acyl-carrier protein] reductase I
MAISSEPFEKALTFLYHRAPVRESMMGVLDGKVGVILGVASERSIAWGIAQALHKEGAGLAFTYAGDMMEKRVRPLAESLGAKLIVPCDVTRDEEITRAFEETGTVFGGLDFVIHSLAFANRDDLKGRYLDTSREGFRVALDVSAYSLVAVARAAAPLMRGRRGSVVTLSFYGAEKVIPQYNVMGVAKAALEASVRYLAADLGPDGIRVNAISAGPIKTLAAAGIAQFRDMLHQAEQRAPLRRNITLEDVGGAALYLCSDWSAGVTGEVLYVDCGYHVMGA